MGKILVLGGVGAMATETTRDLAKTSSFDEITVADINLDKARALVESLGDRRLKAVPLKAENINEMARLMAGHRVVANGLPRLFCENAIRAAIQAGVDMLDLVSPHEETLALDGVARDAGISVVGGVGITPGITNILARLAAERLDRTEQIDIDFAAFRSIAHSPGLLHVILWEFDPRTDTRFCYEQGRLIPNPPFSGAREVHFPEPIGKQTTYYVPHGESQTLSKNIEGVERVYIRGCFPPRAMRLVRALYDYGLYAAEPVEAGSGRRSPLDVIRSHLLAAPEGDQTELWGYSVQVEAIGRLDDSPVMLRYVTSHPPHGTLGRS